jgi:uncharacterized protein YprB with RNaseH-like and TPR domain
MTSLTDRLRDVMGRSRPRGAASSGAAPAPAPALAGSLPTGAADAADILEGDWRQVQGQRFLVVDRTYTPGHRHGNVAMADAMPPSDGLWPTLAMLADAGVGSFGTGRLVFIDLETTGLAGGAGTYAFLVGCGWFEPPSPALPSRRGIFRIRQFFLSSFAAERALLDALGDAAAGAGVIVTYNGKTFDLPLIDTRFVMNRMPSPFERLPHIDMLHPARRLWRGAGTARDAEEGSCRLSVVEQAVCGTVRDWDVAGFEIPSRYFHYVRSGDARPLAAVLEHNRLDLLSLALLTSRAAQLLEEGPTGARTAREALGLGRLYAKGGLMHEARCCFAQARALPGDIASRAEALRAYAVLSRRERRHREAADAWREILQLRPCPPNIAREATEALAVHHEHRLRDPGSARTLALQALQFSSSAGRREALHYRLARLDRKLATVPAQAMAPLF